MQQYSLVHYNLEAFLSYHFCTLSERGGGGRGGKKFPPIYLTSSQIEGVEPCAQQCTADQSNLLSLGFQYIFLQFILSYCNEMAS
jgi:hypothetical protein